MAIYSTYYLSFFSLFFYTPFFHTTISYSSSFQKVMRYHTAVLLDSLRWGRSLDMAEALCKLQFEIKGRRRRRQEIPHTTLRKEKINMDEVECLGNFPNSTELMMLDEETLRERCNLGYRAKRILELARSFENGEAKLKKFEKAVETRYVKEVCEMLDKKRGFGPFASANVLMCMGYYERIPTDSETLRHVKEVRSLSRSVQAVTCDGF